MSIIGDNIKKLRLHRNLTLTQLSNMCGVAQSTISDLESGKSVSPRTDTLSKLANALGVPVVEITEMEIEEEYRVTDVEEAMKIILEQDNLMLHGNVLTDDDKIQLANSIKLALSFLENNKKLKK